MQRSTMTLKQLARQVMRETAHSYWYWIHPDRFDGTPRTYNDNIHRACLCLQAAKELRKLSQELL